MSQEAIYGRSFDEADGRTLPAETTCPECDGAVATEGGETCCTGCGLIIEEYRIDHTGNLRARFDEEKNEPAPHSLRDTTGGSRKIGWKRDANGNALSAEKRRRLNRQRTQHRRAQWRSKAERNLAHACSEIARMVSAPRTPAIRSGVGIDDVSRGPGGRPHHRSLHRVDGRSSGVCNMPMCWICRLDQRSRRCSRVY